MSDVGGSLPALVMRLAWPLAAFAVVALAAYAPRPTPAPSVAAVRADSTEWVNLLILPDSLTRDELIGTMRSFSDALGVRCTHCHVRTDGEMDFPSDANPHKEIARGMMRLTWQINREILPAIDGLHSGDQAEVTCYTCHRGATMPTTSAPDPSAAPAPRHSHG